MYLLKILRFFVVGISMILALEVQAKDAKLPSGWRNPTAQELSDSWRANSLSKYSEILADLRGDGEQDRALLLMSRQRDSFALFIHLAYRGRNSTWVKVIETSGRQNFRGMGIELVVPGKYKTACGKGYDSCRKGDPMEISTTLPIINLFKTESANSYVYFDAQSNIFRTVWMSD